MRILSIEFSSSLRSVAVGDSELADSEIHMAFGPHSDTRSTKIISLIEQVLVTAKIPRETIDCLAIASGKKAP